MRSGRLPTKDLCTRRVADLHRLRRMLHSWNAALLVVLCATGFAQRERIEMGWTGENGYFERRTPSSDHPLQYYLSAERQQEFLRAETDDCATKSVCDESKVEVSQRTSDGRILPPLSLMRFQTDSSLSKKVR